MEWTLIKRFRQLPLGLEVDSATLQVLTHDNIPSDVAEALCGGFRALIMDNATQNCYCLEKYSSSWLLWGIGSVDMTSLQFTEDEKAVESTNSNEDWTQMNIQALLPQWTFQGDKTKDESCELNMTPPGATNIEHKSSSHIDPEVYLTTKYYETLFSPELPLAYFVKTTLPRFSNLCKRQDPDNNGLMSKVLQTLLLTASEFDSRHSEAQFLSTISEDSTFNKTRKHCLAKYNVHIQIDGDSSSVSDRGKDLALVLKSREIKLQMLLLLQLIEMNDLDKNFKNFQERYGKKLKKRSLNVTRRQRHKKVNAQTTTNTEPDYCELLDLYLDKLSILEMLLDTGLGTSTTKKAPPSDDKVHECKMGLLDKSKESSSTGFTRYILIPYFSKKMPKTVKFIMHKIKGPSLKPVNLASKRTLGVTSVTPQDSAQPTTGNSPTPSRSPSIRSLSANSYSRPHLSRKPSLSSQTTQLLTPDLLESRTNSNLSEFLEADTKSSFHKIPSSLSRTTSDLVMNHLQRRQLSVTDLATTKEAAVTGTTAHRSKTFASTQDDSINTSMSSQISFRRVGKRKLTVAEKKVSQPLPIQSPDKVQVMATPMGKRGNDRVTKQLNMDRIVESPPVQQLLTPSAKPLSVVSPLAKTVQSPPARKKVRRRLFGP